MEQLVILIIIGLISLVNWVLQKAAEKRELARMKREADRGGASIPAAQPPPVPATPRTGRSEDPLRELMEALGLPPDSVPPPTTSARRVQPPEIQEDEFASMEEAEPPPPLPDVPPAPRQPEPRWQQPAPLRPDEATARLASAFNAYEHAPAAAPSASAGGVRGLLANRDSQRHAIILAEIFGTPRALRPAGDWLPAGAR
jgi:hypothetical protein